MVIENKRNLATGNNLAIYKVDLNSEKVSLNSLKHKKIYLYNIIQWTTIFICTLDKSVRYLSIPVWYWFQTRVI